MYSREAGEERREVGVALSASVAMFNHDCEPSADWVSTTQAASLLGRHAA